ncbi:YaaA family protein, partial [Flavobacteriaceae bacterium]|nr:YaaA family protein [Flavobacteriaceae bacterium]
MKILISPAKSLDFENKVETSFNTVPLFNDKAIQVNNSIKDLSAPDLSRLMTISPKLSDLNWLRNQDFQKNNSKEKQAIFAFNGDVYDGIDAITISTS